MSKIQRVNSNKRGYGYDWQKARLSYLDSNPLCVMCKAIGRTTPATVVDHIKPHRGDRQLFWDRENWQSLCAMHHDSVKKRIENSKSGKAKVFGWDIYGRPVCGQGQGG